MIFKVLRNFRGAEEYSCEFRVSFAVYTIWVPPSEARGAFGDRCREVIYRSHSSFSSCYVFLCRWRWRLVFYSSGVALRCVALRCQSSWLCVVACERVCNKDACITYKKRWNYCWPAVLWVVSLTFGPCAELRLNSHWHTHMHRSLFSNFSLHFNAKNLSTAYFLQQLSQ